MTVPLHPDLAPLDFLVGTWQGRGRGHYPTIEPFEYAETVTIGHVGKPVLAYGQRTIDAGDGRPLHAESGFFRLHGGAVEFVCAQPSGHTELATGLLDGTSMRLVSSSVVGTPTAKSVVSIERDLRVDGDILSYDLYMAAVGVDLTHHLHAELQRVP